VATLGAIAPYVGVNRMRREAVRRRRRAATPPLPAAAAQRTAPLSGPGRRSSPGRSGPGS
jgi:hypothetical protein